MKTMCKPVCLVLREARAVTIQRRPAKTGVGMPLERFCSQMANGKSKSLSGWLTGCLAGLVAY